MATTREEVQQILDDNGPELLRCIDVNEYFEAELVKKKVVQQVWREDQQGKERSKKVGAVLEAIRRGTVKQYQGFLEALQATNQLAALEILDKNSLEKGASSDQQPMDSAKAILPLWDPKHPEGGIPVKFTDKYKGLLNKKRSDVADIVVLDDLWPMLKQFEILDKNGVDRIKAQTTPYLCVDALIDHLEINPVWKLHAFLRVCVLSDKGYIVTILGLNKDDYS